MRKVCLICMSIFLLGYAAAAVANPGDYPEYAQQKVSDNIPIQFITVETLKKQMDNASSQIIIDVRSREGYDKSHLPGALSIPLRTLPDRQAEVPRDIPLVLY